MKRIAVDLALISLGAVGGTTTGAAANSLGFILARPQGRLPFHQSDWSTDLAYGLGVEGTLCRLSIRPEYERIHVRGGDPDMLSLGITWTL